MNRDDENLDRWLSGLRAESPTGAQMRRWRQAIRRRPRAARAFPRQLVAGLALGFLIGFGVFKFTGGGPDREPAGNFDPTATVETVYDKER